ncbi:MAG TPA: tryptophan halogenase family protein [Sphingomicrobium sp.]|nr:tryptophan halogenase family protein [Sphingomicrobium sp.]
MNSNPSSTLRIVILGDGLDAAMAAAVLARALPRDHHPICLVGTGTGNPSFGPVEATLPSIRRFHSRLGIGEETVLQDASGSFSLGTAYAGWSGTGTAFFAPFGDIGSPLQGVAFRHLAQRLRAAGAQLRLADYSIAAMLAQSGRFTRPLDDPRSPLSTYTYGLHLDVRGYANLLFASAERAGVTRARSAFRSAELAEDGQIAALACADGSRVEADVVIDASGPAALLAGTIEGARFQSWSHWLPWDSAAAIECDSPIPPAPYALVTAERFGWLRTVPGNGRLGECIAYASSELSGSEATDRLVSAARGTPVSEPSVVRVKPGRLAEQWRANCIAVGEAAAMLEPTSSTSFHLLQAQLERLVELFPTANEGGILRREFNRLTSQELDRTRDFVILRYKLNGRAGERVWDSLRAMTVPDELAYKLERYAARGRVPLLDGDMFDEAEWAAIFDELGVRPKRYDVLADAMPVDGLQAQFARMRQVMLECVRGVPLHGDYLKTIRRSAAA